MAKNLGSESNEDKKQSSISTIVAGYVGGMLGWLITGWVSFNGYLILDSYDHASGAWIDLSGLAALSIGLLGSVVGGAIAAGVLTYIVMKQYQPVAVAVGGGIIAAVCTGVVGFIGALLIAVFLGGDEPFSVYQYVYICGAFWAGVGGAIGGSIGNRKKETLK